MAEETVPLVEEENLGNPVPIILGVVGTLVVAFFIVNIALFYYAQREVGPAHKGKKLGTKKVKRDAMKQGLRVLGD